MTESKVDPNATYFEQSESGRAKLANYNLGIADSWIKAITEVVTNSHFHLTFLLHSNKVWHIPRKR